MATSAAIPKNRKEPALDAGLLRSTREAERLRRGAVQRIIRQTNDVRRESSNLKRQRGEPQMSAREIWPIAEDAADSLVQVQKFLAQAKRFEPDGRLVNVLETYEAALEEYHALLLSLCARQVKNENEFSTNVASFAQARGRTTRIPFAPVGATPTAMRAPSFPMPRGASSAGSAARGPSVRRAGGAAPMAGGGGGGNAPIGRTSTSDRAASSMARRQMQAQVEYNEWQQDFFPGFERKLLSKLDELKKEQKRSARASSGSSGGFDWLSLLGGGGIGRRLGGVVRGAGRGVMGLLRGGLKIAGVVGGGLAGALMGGAEGIGTFFKEAQEAISTKWGELSGWVEKQMGGLNDLWKKGTGAVDATLKEWKTAIGTTYDEVVKKVQSFVDDAASALSAAKDKIAEKLEPIREVFAGIKNTVSEAVEGAMRTLSEWGDNIGSVVGKIKDNVKAGFSAVAEEITSLAGRALETAKSMGKSVAEMASTGAGRVAAAVGGGAAGAVAGEAAGSAAGAAARGAGAVASEAAPSAAGTVMRGAGRAAGAVGRVAGAAGGVAIDAALGAIYTEDNLGMAPGTATASDRVGGAAIGAVTGIPGMAVDASNYLTGTRVNEGVTQRAARSAYDAVMNTQDQERAKKIAARILAGEAVSADELGGDIGFLNLVRRSMLNLVDAQSYRAMDQRRSASGVDPSLLPGELGDLMKNPRAQDFLRVGSNGTAFGEVGLKIAESAKAALDQYIMGVQGGAGTGSVRMAVPAEVGALAEQIRSYIENLSPAQRDSNLNLRFLPGASQNFTAESAWATFNGNATPNERRAAFEWMVANNVQPQDPNNQIYKQTLVRVLASAGADGGVRQAILNMGGAPKMAAGGLVSGGAIAVSGDGTVFSMAERGTEAVMPLVDGPQGYGIRAYGGSAAQGTPGGDVQIAPESMTLQLGQPAARELGRSVGEAIADAGVKPSDYAPAQYVPMPRSHSGPSGGVGTFLPGQSPVPQVGPGGMIIPGSGPGSVIAGRPATPSMGGAPSAGSVVPSGPTTSMGTELGALSARYESGGRGSSAIGFDRTGGHSYGTYQIATRTGTMDKFMQHLQMTNPEMAAKLQEAGGSAAALAGDPKFKAAWQQMSSDSAFGAAQHDFIKASHYDPLARKTQALGIDPSQRSKALQDVIWSTAVQHGGNTDVIQKALARTGKSAADVKDDELINAIYDERGTRFGSSDANIQASVQNRFRQERQQALAAAANPGTAVAANPAVPGATAAASTATPAGRRSITDITAEMKATNDPAKLAALQQELIGATRSTTADNNATAARGESTAASLSASAAVPAAARSRADIMKDINATNDPAKLQALQQELVGSYRAQTADNNATAARAESTTAAMSAMTPNLPGTTAPAMAVPTTETVGAARMPFNPREFMQERAQDMFGGMGAAGPRSVGGGAGGQQAAAGTQPPSLASLPTVLEDFGMPLVNLVDIG